MSSGEPAPHLAFYFLPLPGSQGSKKKTLLSYGIGQEGYISCGATYIHPEGMLSIMY